jgi:hypothetical protein
LINEDKFELLHTVKGNKSILLTDFEEVAKPNIAPLEQCGLAKCL